MNKKIVYVCPICGGTNVQMAHWVNPNTNEVIEPLDPDMADDWCDDCEENVKLVLKD